MIAKILVDVKTNQTNRLFDYVVPSHYEELIEKGMRVIVPFGPRKVQGFVIDFATKSEFSRLKKITELLDFEPVLTKELLELGTHLSEETLCFLMTAYQAMLPAALKVKVKKTIFLKEKVDVHVLTKEWQQLFTQKTQIPLEQIKNNPTLLKDLKKMKERGIVEIEHQVKQHTKKKIQKMIQPNVPLHTLQQLSIKLERQAPKQKLVIDYFMANQEPIEMNQLMKIVNVSRPTIKSLLEKQILTEKDKEVYRNPHEKKYQQTTKLEVTAEQKKALEKVQSSIRNYQHETFLLHGVTGSGKTEIYLQIIEQVIHIGKEAIVLVPEISLTPMMVDRFVGRFGSKVAVLHSGLSHGEKFDEWRKIYRKEVQVVVGARSAIFAPFENLGVIIIDEEHEATYKQEDHPKYHARSVSKWRGAYHQCPVILGSATPMLESYARATKGVYQLLELTERVNNRPMPEVQVIDMRDELRAGNRSMFSRVLLEKIKDRLMKNEQIVLMLNRRGYSTFVMCRSCGHVVECPHCDISLTYHRGENKMKCHYCGYESPMVQKCPECESEHIRFFGTGTERVEEELAKLVPEAKVIRMDVDTTSRKGAHERLLTAFEKKEAHILLGTQMIAKGLDFPNVTLVGVLAADSMLHLPDFRSSERTFQLVTQVSGRAGRHELTGEVIVQSYTPDHYSIELASRYDYHSFYEKEMSIRRMLQYPPYYYIVLITVSHYDGILAQQVLEQISRYIAQQLTKQSVILGPVPSSIPRLNDRYRFQTMIKYKREPKLKETLQAIIKRYQKKMTKEQLQIQIDLNPYNMM